MSDRRTPILILAGAAVFVLGVAFVALPDGWNLLPLFLIALVMAALWKRMKATGRPAEPPLPDRHLATESAADVDVQAESSAPRASTLPGRVNRAFGPVAAGMVIDFVDFATFGPLGLVLGLPVGGLAGYWMGTALGLSRRASVGCAVAAAIYCTLPGTELIPLATIVGACVRFRESGKQRKSTETA